MIIPRMLCHVLHTSSWKHPLCSARAASEVNSVGLEIREYKKRRRSGARLQSATMQISVSPPGRERSPLPPEVSLLCPLKVWQLIRFYSQPCVRKRLQVTELFFFFLFRCRKSAQEKRNSSENQAWLVSAPSQYLHESLPHYTQPSSPSFSVPRLPPSPHPLTLSSWLFVAKAQSESRSGMYSD